MEERLFGRVIMKVFLLYPDREFDFEKQPDESTTVLIKDLELDILFSAMADGDSFLLNIAKRLFLSSMTEPREIYYRQEILSDCLKNERIIRELYQIPISASELRREMWLGIFGSSPGSILSGAVGMLKAYIGFLRKIRQIAEIHSVKFVSDGFRRFFEMIKNELDEDYLRYVETHLKTVEFRDGVLIKGRLGKGNKGADYLLCKPKKGGSWFKQLFGTRLKSYSYILNPRDESGSRALEELKGRAINKTANAVAQAAWHVENFFVGLRKELAFYIGCLNLSKKLKDLGEPVSFPKPLLNETCVFRCNGLYDPTLALNIKSKITGNDINADGRNLVIITGANGGGKTTFMRSVGIAQLMMQCGMFVAAEQFSSTICSAVFTHFRRHEDSSMKSGKLDEELSRISCIIDKINPDAMLLLNESFAATNEQEGSEIARQIVDALHEEGVRLFFVTHLYQFAHTYTLKKDRSILFLRAPKPTENSSFKLTEAYPLSTSYGIDLYKRLLQKN